MEPITKKEQLQEILDKQNQANAALLERMGAAEGKAATIESSLDELKKSMTSGFDDVKRLQVPVDSKAKLLPFTKEQLRTVGVKALAEAPSSEINHKQGSDTGFSKAHPDDILGAFQDENDLLLLYATRKMLVDGSGNVDPLRIRQTKYYRDRYLKSAAVERAHALVKDAFDTADAGSASEWVPTEYSPRMWEKIRLDLVVASMFETIQVPRFPFTMPSWLNDMTAFKFAENTSHTGQTNIADALGSTSVSGKIDMSGKTLAGMALWSWELDDDSIVAMLPFLEKAIRFAIRNGLETAIINGDTTATHQDSDTTAATDARKLWDGLRMKAIAGTADISAANAKLNTSGNWGTYVDVGARAAMGKYGVNPAQLFWLVGPKVAAQIRQVSEFRTLYSNGPQATALHGGSGLAPDGVPLIVSEFMREDLNASGVYDGSTVNRAGLLMAHRGTLLLGVGREIRTQVLREVYAPAGQYAIIASWRGDFVSPLANSQNHVGFVYNISVA